MVDESFKNEIKTLIVNSLKLDREPASIEDDGPLFGEAGLGLDSIDALELAVAVERQFHVTIPDEQVGKQAFSSLRALATYIDTHRQDNQVK